MSKVNEPEEYPVAEEAGIETDPLTGHWIEPYPKGSVAYLISRIFAFWRKGRIRFVLIVLAALAVLASQFLVYRELFFSGR